MVIVQVECCAFAIAMPPGPDRHQCRAHQQSSSKSRTTKSLSSFCSHTCTGAHTKTANTALVSMERLVF